MKKKGNFFHKEKDKKENFHKNQEAFKHKPFKNNRILIPPPTYLGLNPIAPYIWGGVICHVGLIPGRYSN
jgi:hypothetical protein